VYSAGSKYYYFSTQWNGSGNYDLTFQNLKEYFEGNFECKVIKIGKEFKLLIVEENNSIPFESNSFYNDLIQSNLKFEKTFSTRLIASLCTKPFLILTGLTGSGKTKLAQSFAYWLSGTVDQYEIVPVGADWTNREPLLGYPDGLNQEMYIHPDSKVLELIMRAEESDLPHFIILDEMNLSHVERYFADFLSIMESGETAKLYSGVNRKDGYGKDVPQQISWPKNLYIIGTVNIDESTYMFSPKVLDRANVIEFRVTELEMERFLKSDPVIDLSKLRSKGASMGIDFVSLSSGQSKDPLSETNQNELLKFFGELKRLGAEFGYRSASEISSLLNNLNKVDSALSMEDKLDIAIMQKMLPKLHGSRSKLLPVLEKLGKLCLKDISNWDAYLQNKGGLDIKAETNVIYKLSFEKIIRMYGNAMDNGFASYAEA
jgi:5-methylcytosine-specific restriction protein B